MAQGAYYLEAERRATYKPLRCRTECGYSIKEVKTKLSGTPGLQMSCWPISCASGPPSEGLEKAKVEGP